MLIFSSSYLQLNSIVISCQFQYNNHKLNFQNLAGEGSSNFLNFVRGDLILLDDDTSGEAVLTSGWCTGTCERTEERGDFPAEAVYVLPCLSRPPDDILVSCRFQQIYTEPRQVVPKLLIMDVWELKKGRQQDITRQTLELKSQNWQHR